MHAWHDLERSHYNIELGLESCGNTAFAFFRFSIIIERQMQLLSRLLVVLTVCLIAIALPAVPAQAAICLPYGIDLSPKNGPPGTEVTISGHDFAADKLVDIYYDGTLIVWGYTDSSGYFTLRFTVPEGCTGPYEVLAKVGRADLGTVEVHTYFTVRPGLTVNPEEGPAGTNVTVTGHGFAKNEAGIELMYYLNGSYDPVERDIAADANGSWQANFTIPTSTREEHKLDAQGTISKLFEVKDAVFRVTAEISIDRSSGFVGDSITMTGGKFAAYEKGIEILFDGQAVVAGIKADGGGNWEATFQVPDMPAGEYSVTAEGEQTKREDLIELSFQIGPHIVLSAYEGYAGMDLTVVGHGFAASEDVVVTYDGNQVATAQTDPNGDFEASFIVPESEHGEHKIAAGYAGENHANAIFTMESNPPAAPTLVSPSSRSRLGFMGSVTPTFEWSAVSDDSGVRYSLQVAVSDNLTAGGEFVDPIVSVTNLAETSYTLAEALPRGTYYWIVQAIDGAENESDWTAIRSFRVGLLPMWTFILIIVAIVVLLGALIRMLVRRRSLYYDRW